MNLRYLLPIVAGASIVTSLAGCGPGNSAPKPPPGFKDKVIAVASPSDKPVVVVTWPVIKIRTAADWSIPETAADSLKRIGAPAVPPLIDMLRDPDPAMRTKAAQILAGIGPDAVGAVSMLQTTSHDSDADVRRWSIRALGQIGEAAAPAVPDVIQALREREPPPDIRVTPGPTPTPASIPGPPPPFSPPPTRTPGTIM